MKCPNCKERIPNNSDFCPICDSIIFRDSSNPLEGVDELLQDGYSLNSYTEYEKENHDEHDNFVAEYSCKKTDTDISDIEAKRQEVRDRIEELRKAREAQSIGTTVETNYGSKSPMKPKVKLNSTVVVKYNGFDDSESEDDSDEYLGYDESTDKQTSILTAGGLMISIILIGFFGLPGIFYLIAQCIEGAGKRNNNAGLAKIGKILRILILCLLLLLIIGSVIIIALGFINEFQIEMPV